MAGRRPDASSTVRIMSLSNIILVNLAAVAAGIPLCEVNLLLRNTGLVKTKSSAQLNSVLPVALRLPEKKNTIHPNPRSLIPASSYQCTHPYFLQNIH